MVVVQSSSSLSSLSFPVQPQQPRSYPTSSFVLPTAAAAVRPAGGTSWSASSYVSRHQDDPQEDPAEEDNNRGMLSSLVSATTSWVLSLSLSSSSSPATSTSTSTTQRRRQQHHHPPLRVDRPIIGTFNTLPVYGAAAIQPPKQPPPKQQQQQQHDKELFPARTSYSCVQQKRSVGSSSSSSSTSTIDDEDEAWRYRTCRYENLCWDVTAQEYVLLLPSSSSSSSTTTTTTTIPIIPPVSLGGINPRWDVVTTTSVLPRGGGASGNHPLLSNDRNSSKLKWSPKPLRLDDRKPSSFSSTSLGDRVSPPPRVGFLDDHIVLLPFHSMAGHNVGHLLWDDLFALYCLVWTHLGRPLLLLQPQQQSHQPPLPPQPVPTQQQQQQQQQQQLLLLIRQSLPSKKNKNNKSETFLYANCDIRRNKRIGCQENFVRFLPYFGTRSSRSSRNVKKDPPAVTTTTTTATTFSSTNQINITGHVDLVCARTALAGLAYWTDHGRADHGWDYRYDSTIGSKEMDQQGPHNLARGKLFYEFGQYLLSHHHQQQQQSSHNEEKPSKTYITFSLASSRDVTRRLDFAPQIAALKKLYRDEDDTTTTTTTTVRALQLRDLSVDEQMSVAASTRIYITACGGGAVTVTFLPRHTSVIIFYDDTGGLDFATFQSTGQPARLDWDLLTNASHLRVHWLPIQRMNEPAHLRLFQALIVHEMALMDRIRQL